MYWLHAINTITGQPTGCMYVYGTEQGIRDNCQRLGYEVTTLIRCSKAEDLTVSSLT